MKNALVLAAAGEAATGLALLIVPSFVGRLLLGEQITGVAVVIGRVTGIALIALGISCWRDQSALCGMLTYTALATLYLAYLGVGSEFVGKLLWPAVALHAILTAILARVWFQSRKSYASNERA